MPGSSKGAIVLTTINSPTEAVRELAKLKDEWPMIVVGDNKTPPDWAYPGVEFLSMASQAGLGYSLGPLLPENHYCRKNLGYLRAIESGVEIIAETDDDNVPYRWDLSAVDRRVKGQLVRTDTWVNVYQYFTEEKIWPRGYPLDLVLQPALDAAGPVGTWTSTVQQFLASGDPDVDAVYRLTVGKDDHRYREATIILDVGTITPFNSQSTVWFRESFAYLYLPSFVSFRMTDIWRSFVAQVCLWKSADRLSYHSEGVWQDRNAHNLLRDFADETVGYLRNDEIVTALRGLELAGSPGENLLECYQMLNSIGIVPDQELPLVEAWLADLEMVMAGQDAG